MFKCVKLFKVKLLLLFFAS